MPGPDIRLNSQLYSLSTREDGTKIVTRPVQQFVQSIKDTGRTRPEDVSPYETFIHPNLSYGFGRYRINSDAAFSAREYRRCWDSTCETRWPDAVYLPILSEDTTQTGLDIARASAEFKGELNCLFESSGTVVNRQFTGSNDTWENGGDVNFPFKSIATTAPTGTSFTISHKTVGANRCLVVILQANEQCADPSSIAYAGDAMTKAGSYAGAGAGSTYVGMWYLVNPDLGTNNLVISQQDSSGGSIAANNISIINLTGIDQDNPVRTAGTAAGTGTSSTFDLTTVAGDLCIDAITVDDGPTVTVGANQTSRRNSISAGDFTAVISTEVATTTTTTMSHSWSGSEPSRHVGIPFRIGRSGDEASVGLDIIQHKTNLVALIAEEQSQLAYTSTDGATWTPSTTQPTESLLLNDIQTDENIDAGLLVTTGLGELCAAVWDEDSSTITFFSSTDAGVTWADESTEIPSAGGPKGIVAYPDVDRTTKLYVATEEGIHVVDSSVNPWTTEFIYPMTHHANNGRRMVVHGGSIWFAQGVDADTPAPIYRLTVSGDRRAVESGYGLNQGDGVPSELLGSVNYMKSAGDFLFISVGGHDGTTDRFSRILCHNGLGWHHMTEYGTADKPIEWIDVGSGDDGVPRLHYAVRTATTTSDLKFLEQPLVNPRSQVPIKREDDSSGVIGYVDLPYIDLGMPHESKNFLRAHVNGEDLNSSASDEYITIQYGKDDAARTTTALGNFTSATTVNTFQSNAGESAKNIGMRVNLLRGSTNTDTPILKDLIVEGMVVPGNGNLMYQHEMIIDIDQTADMLGLNTETVYSNLKTLLATVTQVDLEFGSESRKVTVDRESSQFHTYLDGEASSSAPNGLAIRKGKLRLILTERIPLS